MSETSTNERRERTVPKDDTLYYSLLFQLLKKETGATQLVAWRGTLENLHIAFSCAASGMNANSVDVHKRRSMIERVRKTGRSVVSKINAGESPDASSAVELLCLNGKNDVVQIAFHSDSPNDSLDQSIKKAEELTGLNFEVAESNALDATLQNSQPITDNTSLVPNGNGGQLDFFRNINQSLDLNSTAFNIANEVRLATGCDRATVFRIRGKRVKTMAVSGIAVVNRRSKEIRQLESVVKKTSRSGESFRYPNELAKELPRELQNSLSEFLADQSTRSLAIVPIEATSSASQSTTNVGNRKKRHAAANVIGAIAIEHFQQQVEGPELITRNEELAHCAGDSFRNAINHHSLFLYPVWRVLGRAYEFLIGRHLTKTVAVTGFVMACLFAAVFVQAEYRLSCEGELLPEARRTVYAEIDGLVTAVLADTGDSVSVDQPLVQLENKELLIRQQELTGNVAALTERIESIDRFSMGDPRNPGDAANGNEPLAMERAGLKKQVETIEAQLSIIEQQIKLQTVCSPISGDILTANLVQELADRPVSKGVALLEVADTNGEWVVDLKLPDRKIGEFLTAQEEHKDAVPVAFVLASDPDQKHIGNIKSTELKLDTDETIGQYLRIVVEFNEDEITNSKVGTEIVAYIQCGKRSLGFIWSKEVVDFVRKRILFPYW